MIIGGLVLIGAILLLTMFYTVEADEVAVVQRFGKYVRQEEPGLHSKLPFGLETVRKVPSATDFQRGVWLPDRRAWRAHPL